MSGLSFAQPQALASLLVALPLVALFWLLNFKMRSWSQRQYGEARLLSKSAPLLALKQERKVLALWLSVAALIAISAADPVLPAAPSTVSTGTMQVVVVIDVSNSMAQEYYRRDMSVPGAETPQGAFGTCLDMAKHVTVDQIMPAIRGNEIGVVAYAGRGFPQAELTTDFESVGWVLSHWMNVKDVPGNGSDYAAGLRQAVAIFDRSAVPASDRVIVLFSDGGFTGSDEALTEVLAEMNQRGIRLVVVALGSPTPMPIPMYDWQDRYVGDFPGHGDVELVRTDEANLRALAQRAEGQYVRLLSGQNFDVDWAATLSSGNVAMVFSHIFQFPLALAALVFAFTVLRGLKLSQARLPANVAVRRRRPR